MYTYNGRQTACSVNDLLRYSTSHNHQVISLWLCVLADYDYLEAQSDPQPLMQQPIDPRLLAHKIMILRNYMRNQGYDSGRISMDSIFDRLRRNKIVNSQGKRGPGSCINNCLGSAISFIRCKSMCHWYVLIYRKLYKPQMFGYT